MKFIEKELLVFSRRVARHLARRFKIHYRGVRAVDKRRAEYKVVQGQTDEDLNGRCYIELVFKNKRGKLYSIHQLVDTICHELSHVITWKEQEHHSQNWRAWYKKIKDYADGKLF